MNKELRITHLFALFCTALNLFSVPALAQHSGGSGGNSGGGGGAALTTITVAMNNHGVVFNGVLPQGTAKFAYSKNATTRNLDIQVSNLNVPDGTVVTVQSEEALRVTGRCWHYEWHYYSMTIQGGAGTLSFHSDRGDVVPFLDPKKGWTQIAILPDLNTRLSVLDGLLPFRGRL